MPAASVDQSDLQGNVLCGYGNRFGHALYAFLHVEHGPSARALLGHLATEVTNAVPWSKEGTPWYRRGRVRTLKPNSTLNVALTHTGLRALGVRPEVLRSFPKEFQVGMAAQAELLGDTGASGPGRWEEGLRPGKLHLLVT